MVKSSPSMKGVKHNNLSGQNLDHGSGWWYRHLCSVPPCQGVVITILIVQTLVTGLLILFALYAIKHGFCKINYKLVKK